MNNRLLFGSSGGGKLTSFETTMDASWELENSLLYLDVSEWKQGKWQIDFYYESDPSRKMFPTATITLPITDIKTIYCVWWWEFMDGGPWVNTDMGIYYQIGSESTRLYYSNTMEDEYDYMTTLRVVAKHIG